MTPSSPSNQGTPPLLAALAPRGRRRTHPRAAAAYGHGFGGQSGAALTQEAQGKTQGKLDAATSPRQVAGNSAGGNSATASSLLIMPTDLAAALRAAAMPLACSTSERAKCKAKGRRRREKRARDLAEALRVRLCRQHAAGR